MALLQDSNPAMSRHLPLLLLVLALLMVAAVVLRRPRPPAAPATPQVASSGPAATDRQPRPIYVLHSEPGDGSRRYTVSNRVAGPIEVACVLGDASNVVSDPPLPLQLTLAAHVERTVTRLRALDQGQAARTEVRCQAVPGDPAATPAVDVHYRLPFYAGTAWTLQQGFNGPFSHQTDQSRYALDFGVPVGTPVLAARGGTVMEVEDAFHGHGLDLERYGDRANYVRILQADGSMAVYAHLAPESVIVGPGDRVRAGDFLGKSGDTGYTTGPHLHFVVQRNAGMRLLSIPFSMDGVNPDGGRR
jgi:murein DD-endopeptidase MepM/ murein hydrolase activator NlpD